MVFKPKTTAKSAKDADDVVRVQVTLTKPCYRVIKQYAALRGMTMSQVLYLATRHNLHREALDHEDVKRLFEREGIPFDDEVIEEWRNNIREAYHLDKVFEERPAEAIPQEDIALAPMADASGGHVMLSKADYDLIS